MCCCSDVPRFLQEVDCLGCTKQLVASDMFSNNNGKNTVIANKNCEPGATIPTT
jgi:hypothetical protein